MLEEMKFVIGVVAALTLPSVVNNFKRKSFETQKKTN